MARFTYIAEKNNGEEYKGVADAQDRFELYKIVRGEGGHIVSVAEEHGSRFWGLSRWNAKLSSISEYEQVLFARNLGAMLTAGLPLARALSVIERQTSNPKMSALVSEIASDVRRGDPLHAVLMKHPDTFSRLFIAMVRVGEEGGSLPASLSVTSDQMERMYELKKKIRGALIYPSIVVCSMIGIGVLMMIKVVPTLTQTFTEMKVELPISTQVVIAISDFLVQYTFVSFFALIGIVASVYAAVRTQRGRRVSDFLFLHTPLIGNLVREVNAARTARTLASLISSGVDVLTALDITGEVVQNAYFQDVIRAAARAVRAGEPLSASFTSRTDLYPAFVGEMMAVGEETGQTKDMLDRLALFYEEEVDRKTKDMSTVIEPFLMIFIGVIVGLFAVSMITPIYSLSQSIG